MGVLAQDQHVLQHQAEHQGEAEDVKDGARADEGDDRGVKSQEHERVAAHCTPIGGTREQPEQPRQMPVIGEPVDDREERDPQPPAHVEEDPFCA